MRLNIVTKSAVPEGPYTTHLACGPTAAVPYTLGALVLKSQRYWYASPEDWHRGRKLLAQLGVSMLQDCGLPIVNAIDRVYNLLDAGLNGIGRGYTGTGTEADPYVYSPPLEQTPDPADYLPGGLRSDANTLRALLDNLVTGTTSAVAPAEAVPNAKLEAIRLLIEAMGEGDGPTAEQVAQIISILGAV